MTKGPALLLLQNLLHYPLTIDYHIEYVNSGRESTEIKDLRVRMSEMVGCALIDGLTSGICQSKRCPSQIVLLDIDI
jgi:hypothetical protein